MGKSNKVQTQFVKIKQDSAEKFLKLLKKKLHNETFLDRRTKVKHEGVYVLFPLIDDAEKVKMLIGGISNQINFDIVSAEGVAEENYKFHSIEEALVGELPENILELIPKSYDIIGKIAIVEFDQINTITEKNILFYKKKVAEALVRINKSVETVYEKLSEVKGRYRLKDLKIIYGDDNPETIHKENDCLFKLDVKKTYFTPRLVFERKRVSSSSFKKQETIVDMFTGVGPFSIQIAKNNDVKIYAFDVNPSAYKYLIKNIDINKIKGKIIPHNMDVKTLLNPNSKLGNYLKHKIDRIIMNLPEQSVNFLDVACFLMKKSSGIIHSYQFCEKPNPIKKGIENLSTILQKSGWYIEEILKSKIVKPFSPKSDLIVLDLKLKLFA
ncbi:MAG: class I SAM-dependent methyltransferase family protein [Candidatus Lokiarchaeota archaeon]|nr:class I SAM-dependent methyltransferase family protein [Candidatus Lokiarchaeota archaeon]